MLLEAKTLTFTTQVNPLVLRKSIILWAISVTNFRYIVRFVAMFIKKLRVNLTSVKYVLTACKRGVKLFTLD